MLNHVKYYENHKHATNNFDATIMDIIDNLK